MYISSVLFLFSILIRLSHVNQWTREQFIDLLIFISLLGSYTHLLISLAKILVCVIVY